jgi:hypothetical protein|tara:strand:+ start:365 stop:658 length:294 start_codon:yes stop_codon:yes gene_type:complete
MDNLNTLMPGNMTMAVADYLREHHMISLPQAQKLGVENSADLRNIVHRLRKLHGMLIFCADRRTKKYRQNLYTEYVLFEPRDEAERLKALNALQKSK